MKRIVLSLVIIAALSTSILQAKEKLYLLSTIKPVHSLVSAISGELADVEQIIPNYGSPHHYSLRPSDIRKINKADIIFRIDPKLESFLLKSLRSINDDKVISLSEAEGLTLLHANESHHEHDEHDHEEEETKANDHDEALDYHLWLSPDNALVMSNMIRDTIINIAPEHKTQLSQNTELLKDRILEKHQALNEQLEAINDNPFLVMHDAWQYFTKHYELNQLGTISAQERLSPSAKAISEARESLKNSGVKCLIAEPNLKSRTLKTLIEGTDVKVVEMDPLGREIPDSDQAYPQLLQYTADKLLSCLAQK